ncbi:dihydrofolate reductase family protein [Xylanimonas sp. McL0601]|uniref:dihydrofolate reductase family protein n=1 Tax=Xylanimonas sp. McL0601 TaxID=3414739 RepID=UPI003CF010E2
MAAPDLNLLVPDPRPVPADDAEAALAELYRHEPGVVRANMVSSVDGAAWGATHLSGDLNDAADYRVFRVLRALADIVVVGAGTARTERYDQVARPDGLAHLAPSDAPLRLALVTRSGAVPPSTTVGDRPPLIITGSAGAEVARSVVPAENVLVHGTDAPDLRSALGELADRGLTRVLTEGGPHLLASLLAAGVLDELCLTTTALLEGPLPGRIVAGGEAMPQRAATLGHLLHDPAAHTLLARWIL